MWALPTAWASGGLGLKGASACCEGRMSKMWALPTAWASGGLGLKGAVHGGVRST